jgi:predicted aspartyl protease
MGFVRTTITLTNDYDLHAVGQGQLGADAVRSVDLPGVLVDSGATLLCLPSSIIERLGLDFARAVVVETAAGPRDARVFKGVVMSVEGRAGVVEALETPGGAVPLLGVIPLQALGLELDLQRERLVLLPDHGPDTYIMAL